MTKRRPLLLVLLAAAALAGGVWWLGSGTTEGTAPPAAAAAPAAAAGGARSPADPRSPTPSSVEPADPGTEARAPAALVGRDARHVLRGRVVLADDTPVTRFSIEVVRYEATENGSSKRVFARGDFEDADGAFALADVPAGSFYVRPIAEGHAPTRVDELSLPSAHPLQLEMWRLGRVTGVVYDPFGHPRAGARVGPSGAEYTSDASGAFAYHAGRGGPGWLFARADGFGPSALHEFDLAPGASAHFELHLTLGATITGEVLDAVGRPEAQVDVTLGDFSGDRRARGRDTETDEAGRFAMAGLPAGSYVVLVDGGGAGQKLRAAQVELVDGETRHVVLDGRVEDPIVLRVTLTAGGEPVQEGRVYAFPEGPGFLANAHEGRPDEAGRFEVELERPGTYVLAVDARREQRGSLHFVDVPREPLVEVTLALPAGVLRGRVLTAAGEPARGVRVWADRQGDWNPTSLGEGRGAPTDDEGRFELTGLGAGLWIVRSTGTRARAGVELAEDEVREGIELRQEANGLVRGRVVDEDGAPLGDVAVFARDAGGAWVDRFARVSSQPGTGVFVYERLPAGDYTFLARHGARASAESAPVLVAAVDPAQAPTVELRLGPAGATLVTVVDGDGGPLPATITVADGEGRHYESLQTPHDLEVFLEVGHRVNGRVLGPLPPGEYVITARTRDGRTVRHGAAFSARMTSELVLQLD